MTGVVRDTPIAVAGPITAGSQWIRFTMAALTAICLVPFGIGASNALTSGTLAFPARIQAQGLAMIWVPCAALLVMAMRRQFNIALGIYWAWNFVFLGLAPAYQVGMLAFPWKGRFSLDTIAHTQLLILLGHAVFLAGAALTLRRRTRTASADAPAAANLISVAKTLSIVTVGYVAVAVLWCGLLGSALFNGRAQFRDRVLQISQLPFGGTMFFVAIGGAMILPAGLIAARRCGVPLKTPTIVVALLAGALVANPLVGSRFQTGSFFVSVAIALVAGSTATRLLPALSVVLLVLVFPTLAVLRGDASSSTSVRVLSPQTSMLDYDYDAFEMGSREVSLTGDQRAALPSAAELAIAPMVRWIPFASRPFVGDAGGALVAKMTGMQYTNVSMPLWAEGNLVGKMPGVILYMGLLGAWVGVTSRRAVDAGSRVVSRAISLPGTAALLFIVLRGSLYEVLGYLVLAAFLYLLVGRAEARNA